MTSQFSANYPSVAPGTPVYQIKPFSNCPPPAVDASVKSYPYKSVVAVYSSHHCVLVLYGLYCRQVNKVLSAVTLSFFPSFEDVYVVEFSRAAQ